MMTRKITGIIVLSVLLCGPISAHSGKPDFHVIIDTDGALDDMRSITMFLSGNDIRVLAVSCSRGTLLPDSVYVKVKSLLSAFHHEGIPVGIAGKLDKLFNTTVDGYPDKITLVALGSLKSYAGWIRANPQHVDKIERIIWYNDPVVEKGFNYRLSPESFDFIKSTDIELDVVTSRADRFNLGESYLSAIQKTNSVYARQIRLMHARPEIAGEKKQKPLQLTEDIIPLYLTVPILFESDTEGNLRHISMNEGIPEEYIYETIATLLGSAAVTNNRVFKSFPVDSSLYKPEYVQILKKTIENFGLIEWKAISMTNEIHGHTGIYSIIGAKMGIRAMEYFNVGINNLIVTTFAGKKPPLSCLNDGIQISTGATIGQGLITISDTVSVIPTAIFEFNNQQVVISLKPEIAARMQEEIKYGVKNYGLLTEMYWEYIEELAIRYWSEFSRYEIFDI